MRTNISSAMRSLQHDELWSEAELVQRLLVIGKLLKNNIESGGAQQLQHFLGHINKPATSIGVALETKTNAFQCVLMRIHNQGYGLIPKGQRRHLVTEIEEVVIFNDKACSKNKEGF
jgi:hypothetical protein